MFSNSVIDNSRGVIDNSRSVIDKSRSVIDNSRSVTDNSRSVIDNSRVMLQHVASFTIVIYNCHMFIVQARGERKKDIIGINMADN